jgi:hypothetical protein
MLVYAARVLCSTVHRNRYRVTLGAAWITTCNPFGSQLICNFKQPSAFDVMKGELELSMLCYYFCVESTSFYGKSHF